MFFAPRFHEFHRSFFKSFFASCRGAVSNDSPEAQDVTCEAAGALIAFQCFKYPEQRPDLDRMVDDVDSVRRLLKRF